LNLNPKLSDDMHVVAEICDIQHCLDHGISKDRIIGIGYSQSSYVDAPDLTGLHRHYTSSRDYHNSATVLPFGYTPESARKDICIPNIIGIRCDHTYNTPLLEYSHPHMFINQPYDNESFDVYIHASSDDRNSRIIRKAIAAGIPIIGYTTHMPILKHLLIEHKLGFELKESDDFDNTLSHTISYIGANIQFQIMNSMELFRYAKAHLNWDRWIYEFSHLGSSIE
jgi:hypothetical protein